MKNITVIIPCQNYARFLAECIESVRAAGVENIIVIDDASTDSPDRIAELHGVRCVRVEHNNLNLVRLTGLQLAATKYVAFIDADNKVLPAYFAKAIEVMERHRNVAFVFRSCRALESTMGFSTAPSSRLNLPERVRSKTETTAMGMLSGGERSCIRRWPSTRLCRRTSRHTIGAWRGVFFVLDGLRTAAMYRCCTVSTQRR